MVRNKNISISTFAKNKETMVQTKNMKNRTMVRRCVRPVNVGDDLASPRRKLQGGVGGREPQEGPLTAVGPGLVLPV